MLTAAAPEFTCKGLGVWCWAKTLIPVALNPKPLYQNQPYEACYSTDLCGLWFLHSLCDWPQHSPVDVPKIEPHRQCVLPTHQALVLQRVWSHGHVISPVNQVCDWPKDTTFSLLKLPSHSHVTSPKRAFHSGQISRTRNPEGSSTLTPHQLPEDKLALVLQR